MLAVFCSILCQHYFNNVEVQGPGRPIHNWQCSTMHVFFKIHIICHAEKWGCCILILLCHLTYLSLFSTLRQSVMRVQWTVNGSTSQVLHQVFAGFCLLFLKDLAFRYYWSTVDRFLDLQICLLPLVQSRQTFVWPHCTPCLDKPSFQLTAACWYKNSTLWLSNCVMIGIFHRFN